MKQAPPPAPRSTGRHRTLAPCSWLPGNTRVGTVHALGVDEVLFARVGRWRTEAWSTSIVDVAQAQFLDVIPGRSSIGLYEWLDAIPQAWRGSRSASRTSTPGWPAPLRRGWPMRHGPTCGHSWRGCARQAPPRRCRADRRARQRLQLLDVGGAPPERCRPSSRRGALRPRIHLSPTPTIVALNLVQPEGKLKWRVVCQLPNVVGSVPRSKRLSFEATFSCHVTVDWRLYLPRHSRSALQLANYLRPYFVTTGRRFGNSA